MQTTLTDKQTGKATGITFETMLNASAKRGPQNIILNDTDGNEIGMINLYAIEKTSNESFMGNFNNMTTVAIDFKNREIPTFTVFIAQSMPSELTEQNKEGRV